jgi:hypothetical protein
MQEDFVAKTDGIGAKEQEVSGIAVCRLLRFVFP